MPPVVAYSCYGTVLHLTINTCYRYILNMTCDLCQVVHFTDQYVLMFLLSGAAESMHNAADVIRVCFAATFYRYNNKVRN